MKQILFGLLSLIVLAVGMYLYFRPMFSVNGDIIFSPEFKINLSAAGHAQEEFHVKNPNLPSGADLETATANRILETHLVHEELRSAVDAKTLSGLLRNKINSALSNPEFMSAAEKFYGLSASGVKEYVITPQAEEDILNSQLILKGRVFGDWLAEAKREARVKIYFGNFKWNGSSLEKKN